MRDDPPGLSAYERQEAAQVQAIKDFAEAYYTFLESCTHVPTIKALLKTAILVFGDDATNCDLCGEAYSSDMMEACDGLIPMSQTQNDSNGDPDVTMCGFCILEIEDARYN